MLKGLRFGLWAGCGAVALLLLTQPVSVDAQFALSTAVIFAMIVTWKLGRGDWGRQLFLGFSSVVVVRYIFWRSTSTLPPLSDPFDLVPGIVLFLAEIYCVLILVISLVINVDPLRRKTLPREEDDNLPTVDVFIPSYNEDEGILATTIAAAKSMDYPAKKLTVWLLDDGGTIQKRNDKNPEKAAAALQRYTDLQLLCLKMGAKYLTREKNEHAKAGNMNNGLKVSTGELIVVFDADHAPFRNFLRETVGHFGLDPKLFLVQTPHIFLNPDPIEKNLKTFDRMPSENEMFYSLTQRGLDKWDASFFCGSAAVLRRTALETTGGFSGITITEDCETAFELHGNGWHSVFVDKPLIAGLQPETFTSFIGQRSRWCQGMFQILMLKNPALKRGLSFTQRISYLSSMTFWFFPLPRLVFMFAPLMYIFLDTKIFVSNIDETIAYTGMYIIVNLMLQNYLYGRVRWPWISELYEFVQGVFLAKAIFTVVLNPRKPTFNVTAKGLTLDNDHLSELSWPFFAIWGLLFVAGLTAAFRYAFEPGINSLMLVVGLWNTFNLIIAGAALGAVAERAQPDRHPRLPIQRQGRLKIGNMELETDIINVSAGGCALLTAAKSTLPVGSGTDVIGQLSIKAIGTLVRDETINVLVKRAEDRDGGTLYACEFHEMQPSQHFVLADLMYGDGEALVRFLDRRRTHQSIWQGSAQFIKWGVTEPVRAFRYLWLEHQAGKISSAAVLELKALAEKVKAATQENASPIPAVQHAMAAPLHQDNLKVPAAPLHQDNVKVPAALHAA